MIIVKNAPMRKEILNLKRGDSFLGKEVVFSQKVNNIISVITKENYLFTIHVKEHTYSVFYKTRPIKPPRVHS